MVTPNTIENPPDLSGLSIFAATRIVSLIPGDGTDLTIAAAIAALPAAGGSIFIKQGTHPFTPAGTLPANLEIVGTGNLASEIALGGALTFGLGNALKDAKISGAFTVSLGVEFYAEGARFASAVIIPVGADRVTLIGNRFEFVGARSLDIVAGSEDAVIQGNFFSGFTSEAIRTEGLSAIVTENVNCEVTEIGTADGNRYDDNIGFSTSTIIGPDSIVNGVRRKGVTAGATTGAFVTQFTHKNPKGLMGIGTIKNTGANSMEIRETVIDAFSGASISVTTTVLPGNDYMLDLQTNFGTARPPYIDYTVDVRHPGAATTFDLQYAGEGVV